MARGSWALRTGLFGHLGQFALLAHWKHRSRGWRPCIGFLSKRGRYEPGPAVCGLRMSPGPVGSSYLPCRAAYLPCRAALCVGFAIRSGELRLLRAADPLPWGSKVRSTSSRVMPRRCPTGRCDVAVSRAIVSNSFAWPAWRAGPARSTPARSTPARYNGVAASQPGADAQEVPVDR